MDLGRKRQPLGSELSRVAIHLALILEPRLAVTAGPTQCATGHQLTGSGLKLVQRIDRRAGYWECRGSSQSVADVTFGFQADLLGSNRPTTPVEANDAEPAHQQLAPESAAHAPARVVGVRL